MVIPVHNDDALFSTVLVLLLVVHSTWFRAMMRRIARANHDDWKVPVPGYLLP